MGGILCPVDGPVSFLGKTVLHGDSQSVSYEVKILEVYIYFLFCMYQMKYLKVFT